MPLYALLCGQAEGAHGALVGGCNALARSFGSQAVRSGLLPAGAQVMLSKIRSRQYVNWNEVVRDFERICSNAMKYNQKRSRIHKLVRKFLP